MNSPRIEPHGVMVMARWLARKAAIEQLGSQGHKVQYSEPAGTYEATEVYLPEHWAQLVHQAEIVAFDGGTRTRPASDQAPPQRTFMSALHRAHWGAWAAD